MIHRTTIEPTTEPGRYVVVCTECPRRVIIGSGAFTVIDQGDFAVLHSASYAPDETTMNVDVAATE